MLIIQRWHLSLLILSGVSGCAISYYSAVPAPIPQLATMPVLEEKGAVKLGLDPYLEPYRQIDIFHADLTSVGVLAIQILIQNGESVDLRIQRADVQLQLPDGLLISPALSRDVIYAIMPKPQMTTPAWHRDMAARIRMDAIEDYRAKELIDLVIREGQSVHGFMYFMVPNGSMKSKKITLIVPLVELDNAKNLTFRLPVKGFDF